MNKVRFADQPPGSKGEHGKFKSTCLLDQH
jgi:hypothetical protein